MKTDITSSKDNIASATILAVTLFFVTMGVFSNAPVAANHTARATIQKLDTLVITVSRTPDATLETMAVTASRKARDA